MSYCVLRSFRRPFHTSLNHERSKTNRIKVFPYEQQRPEATLDPELKAKLLRSVKEELKPLIGKNRLKCVLPPEDIQFCVEKVFEATKQDIRTRIPQYLAAGVKLRNFLFSRPIPEEKFATNAKISEYARELRNTKYANDFEDEDLSHHERQELERKVQDQAAKIHKWKRINWKSTVYDEAASYAYLLALGAHSYAVTHNVLEEVKRRDPEFQPRTLFDYGSGVGSVTWAVKELFGVQNEVYCVDTSTDMNDLAKWILKRGKASHSLPAGHFFRLSLPASHDLTYDLVTSAFTLSELPSSLARLEAVHNLWQKTNGYLVLVEHGSNAGFEILVEARDYLLQYFDLEAEKDDFKEVEGHLFAPCPHSMGCPRFNFDTIPCNFNAKYKNFQLEQIPHDIRDTVHTDRYSYMIFKKGPRNESDPSYEFPRVVAHPMKKRGHVICRLCTHRGKLEEYVTQKNRLLDENGEGKLLYRYSKNLKLGDQFRVQISDGVDISQEIDQEETVQDLESNVPLLK